jgi:hypothetical protein
MIAFCYFFYFTFDFFGDLLNALIILIRGREKGAYLYKTIYRVIFRRTKFRRV